MRPLSWNLRDARQRGRLLLRCRAKRTLQRGNSAKVLLPERFAAASAGLAPSVPACTGLSLGAADLFCLHSTGLRTKSQAFRVCSRHASVRWLYIAASPRAGEEAVQKPHSRLPSKGQSANVERSPTSCPMALARSTRRMILPLRVLGSLSTTSICAGTAMGPNSWRTCFFSSSSSSGLAP